ncbi:MAG: sigma-54 dependent transcriptional regulator [Blastocatellia bacterium]
MSQAQIPTSVLVIDDDNSMLQLAKFWLEKEGYEVVTAATGEQGVQMIGERQFDVALTDYQLPDFDGLDLVKRIKHDSRDTQIIMITGYGADPRVKAAVNENAFYFHPKPVDFDQLLLLIKRANEHGQQKRLLDGINRRTHERERYYGIIGSSRPMQNLYDIIESVAESDANVLVIGESGTGKELVGNAIHARSQRAKHPFMQVNCAALPKELIESELFGHTKGAFTGAASDKVGLIGRAAGGSLLLDEISEMPLELQPKLLRVLQERVYYRVGSEKSLSADFRLISATNRNPFDAMGNGHLREDLYYRLNTIEMHVPPLRDRIEDIPQLADYFLRRYAEKYQRPVQKLSQEAYEQLYSYHWPGNIRELQNAVERAVLMCKGEVIDVQHLPAIRQTSFAPATVVSVPAPSVIAPPMPFIPAIAAIPTSNHSIEQLCRQIINLLPEQSAGVQSDELFKQLEVYLAQAAVKRTKGNKQAAANLLGIYRPRLYSLLKKGTEQNASLTSEEGASEETASEDNRKETLPSDAGERVNAAFHL